MNGQVTIAGVEPDGLPQLSHVLQAEEGVALDAPSALTAQHAGESIGNRVEVGRNVESPPEQVITGVDDDCELFGRDHLAQAVDELGSAGPACQYCDHAALRE